MSGRKLQLPKANGGAAADDSTSLLCGAHQGLQRQGSAEKAGIVKVKALIAMPGSVLSETLRGSGILCSHTSGLDNPDLLPNHTKSSGSDRFSTGPSPSHRFAVSVTKNLATEVLENPTHIPCITSGG